MFCLPAEFNNALLNVFLPVAVLPTLFTFIYFLFFVGLLTCARGRVNIRDATANRLALLGLKGMLKHSIKHKKCLLPHKGFICATIHSAIIGDGLK